MDLDLRGRTVIVTGGSAGIGLETVRVLLEEGALVVACARDLNRLSSATSGFADAHSGRLHLTRCDALERSQVADLVGGAVTHSLDGSVHGLVCNAGAARKATFRTATADDWAAELDLKMLSTLNAIEEGAPHLEGGRVVAMNSLVSREPIHTLALSSAARATVLSLTQHVAGELAEHDVITTSILLGPIVSDQWRRRFDRSNTERSWEEWLDEQARARSIPTGRFGDPREVATLVAILLSPLVTPANGTVIELAGGIGTTAA